MSQAHSARGVSQAVVGFLPDAAARELRSGKGFSGDELELPLEPGTKAGTVRLRVADIQEVRVGPSSQGHTGVQLVLKPEAEFEVQANALLPDDELSIIRDPGIVSVLGRLRWFVIYAGPIFRQIEAGQFQQVEERG